MNVTISRVARLIGTNRSALISRLICVLSVPAIKSRYLVPRNISNLKSPKVIRCWDIFAISVPLIEIPGK
jgi:hypothetical protein